MLPWLLLREAVKEKKLLRSKLDNTNDPVASRGWPVNREYPYRLFPVTSPRDIAPQDIVLSVITDAGEVVG